MPYISKEKVIAEMCALMSEVGAEAFGHSMAHDCFCNENPFSKHVSFHFDQAVLDYVKEAVHARLSIGKGKINANNG